jgi:hypothetical protein
MTHYFAGLGDQSHSKILFEVFHFEYDPTNFAND